MPATIYDCYGEDGDIAYMDGSVGAGVTIASSGDFYRTSYARCSVGFTYPCFGIRLWLTGPYASAWCSYRMSVEGNTQYSTTILWGLVDASNILRLAVLASENSPQGPFTVVKINAAGAMTTLGVTTSGFSTAPNSPDKFDVFYDYIADPTTPNLLMYINGSLVFSYTGDITTDSQTALAGAYHGQMGLNNIAEKYPTYWSECIVASGDTRDMSLGTTVATGPGTLDQWTGEYTNVNQIAVNDGNFDTTTTAGSAQRYKMGSIAEGNYDILAVVTNLRCTQGGGVLTHIALEQLIASVTYSAAPVNFPTAYGPVQFIQATNPATGSQWLQSDINASAYESGYKATA